MMTMMIIMRMRQTAFGGEVLSQLSTGWVNLQVGLGWVVGVSWQVGKKAFCLLSIWLVKYSLSYLLSTRVITQSVSAATIIGLYTSAIQKSYTFFIASFVSRIWLKEGKGSLIYIADYYELFISKAFRYGKC